MSINDVWIRVNVLSTGFPQFALYVAAARSGTEWLGGRTALRRYEGAAAFDSGSGLGYPASEMGRAGWRG